MRLTTIEIRLLDPPGELSAEMHKLMDHLLIAMKELGCKDSYFTSSHEDISAEDAIELGFEEELINLEG